MSQEEYNEESRLLYREYRKAVKQRQYVKAYEINREMKIRYLRYCQEMISRSTFSFVVKIYAEGCCPVCDKLDGAIVDPPRELRRPILPYVECVRPKGCVCLYSLENRYNDRGEVIVESKNPA